MLGRSNDKQFYQLFEKHIGNTLVCAGELQKLFGNITEVRERVARIVELEHRGDDLTREAHQLLDHTFITRIDKPDIVNLINELDHIIDFMKATAIRVEIYHITEGRIEARGFMDIIMRMVLLLQKLIGAITHFGLEATQKQVVAMKELEEEADTLLHRALESLFQNEGDAKVIIQWKDIFEKLEMVTDCCEDVAIVISSITRKEAR